MAERMRLYSGVTELGYAALRFISTNDFFVDSAEASIEADSSVTASAVLDIKKDDGTTTVTSGRVKLINERMDMSDGGMWGISMFTNGYELMNTRVEQVYTNVSPEYIVQDIVDNFTTNLTYASSTASGITLTIYIAKGYAIDIIKDMMEILRWKLRIDYSGNVYFEPDGTVTNGFTLTNGTNCQLDNWITDEIGMFNHVKVVGGFQNFSKHEELSGTNTVFTLEEKPEGTMRITESSVEIDPANYTIDAENKTITFKSSRTDPVVDYTFNRPVVVEYQNDVAIAATGTDIFKEIQAPWLNSLTEARRYAMSLVTEYGLPLVRQKATIPGLDFDRAVNELVTVVDSIRGKTTAQYIINRVEINATDNATYLEIGSREETFEDWRREVEDRIKKIERRISNQDTEVFARLLKSNLKCTLELTNAFEYASPVDSFILNHKTLGRMRDNLNVESDCSDNARHGTWNGSGIDGSQFSTSGWRLSTGTFNGSNNYITVGDDLDLDLTSDFTIAVAVKVSPLPGAQKYILNKYDGTDGYAVRINASNKVELTYSNSGTPTTIAASTALTNNVFQHVVFVRSSGNLIVYVNGVSDNTGSSGTMGTNNNAFEVGRYSSNYFSGSIDEVRVWNDDLTAAEVLALYTQFHVRNADCQLYWSMDNPKLGDRTGSRATVT